MADLEARWTTTRWCRCGSGRRSICGLDPEALANLAVAGRPWRGEGEGGVGGGGGRVGCEEVAGGGRFGGRTDPTGRGGGGRVLRLLVGVGVWVWVRWMRGWIFNFVTPSPQNFPHALTHKSPPRAWVPRLRFASPWIDSQRGGCLYGTGRVSASIQASPEPHFDLHACHSNERASEPTKRKEVLRRPRTWTCMHATPTSEIANETKPNETKQATAGGKLLFAKKGSWNVKSFRMMAFDEREIVGGVRDENLIGSGGSGNVYRVKLGCGTVVAVKHITRTRAAAPANAGPTAAMLPRSASSSAKQCREFDAEVRTLSSIRHVNVVKLLCSVTRGDGAASLLVYEHLPNGSLYERLHGPTARKLGGLAWPERYEVAVGAARGLEYLHHGCGDRPILHRDVKSSNILLDEAFRPRIADFGLAKILDAGAKQQGEPWSAVAGTVGYMAPEYAYTRKVTEKSDVYSFGVVLLELATGRAAVADGEDVVEWASRRLDGNGREKAMALLDGSAAREEWEKEEAVRVLRVAVLCTSRTPAVRPSMRSVVQMLEDAAVGRECSGKPAVEVKVVVA